MMKLLFPCCVVSLAVLIAVFGCGVWKREDTGNTIPAKAWLTRPRENNEDVYFIRRKGDNSEVFKSNIIAAPASLIVKEETEQGITYQDAVSFVLTLNPRSKSPIISHISDVMLAKTGFDASKTVGNIALIQFKNEREFRYMKETGFVKENLDWIYENYDKVEGANTQSDLIDEEEDETKVLPDKAMLMIKVGRSHLKTCWAYFLRKEGDTSSPYDSEVFATQADCVVKSILTDLNEHAGKFEYFKAWEFKLAFKGEDEPLKCAKLIDESGIRANEDFKIGQRGGEHDIALVRLTHSRKFTYSGEHETFTTHQTWIVKKLSELFPDGYKVDEKFDKKQLE